MDKETYLRILKRKLQGMNEKDQADALNYVNEYFEDAGVENEQKVMEDLGSPSKFAATLRADAASKNEKINRQEKKSRSSMKTIMTIFLGICAMPLALPLFLVLICLVFVFILLMLCFVLVGFCGIIAFLIGGIPMMIRGFFLLGTPADALISFGGGFLAMGMGILLAIAAYKLVRSMMPWFTNGMVHLYERLRGEKAYEKS